MKRYKVIGSAWSHRNNAPAWVSESESNSLITIAAAKRTLMDDPRVTTIDVWDTNDKGVRVETWDRE